MIVSNKSTYRHSFHNLKRAWRWDGETIVDGGLSEMSNRKKWCNTKVYHMSFLVGGWLIAGIWMEATKV